MLILHKYEHQSSILYTLFDAQERVVTHPTYYLRSLRRRNISQASQFHIANVIKLHCQWLEAAAAFQGLAIDESLMLIESDDVLDWVNDQRVEGLSPRTIHNREVLVRQMYKWFLTDEAGRPRTDIPWNGSSFTREPHHNMPKFVTPEQVIKLLNALHNESQRAAAHFIYDLGIRVSELVRLTNQFLPDESNWPEEVNYYPMLIPGSKARDGNRYKYRYTVISRPMLARVRRYQSTPDYMLARGWSMFDPDKPIFLNVHGEPLSTDSVYSGIKAAWIRQGGIGKAVTPHTLRHGTAFSVLRSEFGRQLSDRFLVLKSLLGHEHIETTEIYASIPITVLQSLSEDGQVRLRHEEAQRIYEATYLPSYKHVERRGHHS